MLYSRPEKIIPSCAAASSDSRLIHFLYESISALGLSPLQNVLKWCSSLPPSILLTEVDYDRGRTT
jgi:hypothetical protein